MTFKPNPNFREEIAASVRPALIAAGEAARAQIEHVKHSIMPRHRSGSVVVQAIDDEILVANTDYGAHIDEYGSVKSEAYAPMRRGTRAAGLRLDEHGK